MTNQSAKNAALNPLTLEHLEGYQIARGIIEHRVAHLLEVWRLTHNRVTWMKVEDWHTDGGKIVINFTSVQGTGVIRVPFECLNMRNIEAWDIINLINKD